jgi:hypothetical protein
MTDTAAPSLDDLSPEERAKFTVTLLNRHLGVELRRLLLDDDFLLEFGPKLRRAMEGRPLVEAQDLEVLFSDEPISEMTFRVFVEREDHPTSPGEVHAFSQDTQERADLSPEHGALIVSALKDQDREMGTYHWVTFRMKGAETTEVTEDAEDVRSTEQS